MSISRKKMQEIISILLISFIIFWSFYIKFHDIESFNQKEKDESYKGVIRIWDYPRININTGNRYAWIRDKIRKFEKKNPGVYIEFKPINSQKDLLKLEVDSKTSQLPDIVPINSDFDYIDILEPLNNFFDDKELKKFKHEPLKAVIYDSEMIGVPFMMTTYIMYLNLDLFNAKGVTPPIDGNWTYNEFLNTLKKLTFDSDGDGIIDKYGFISFIQPRHYNIWGIILSDGAQILHPKKNCYSFYGQKAESGLKKVIDLKQEYKVTPDYFGLIDENQCWEMFCKDKKIAVYPTGTWALKILDNLYLSGDGFNFDVVNYPVGEENVPKVLNNEVGAYGILKQDNKAKLDMCVKFLKFIVNDTNQRTLEELGMFTVRNDIQDMYVNNPKMKKIEKTISYTQVLPRHKKWKEIDNILQNQVKLAIIGEKSYEDVIKEAKKQVEQLMK